MKRLPIILLSALCLMLSSCSKDTPSGPVEPADPDRFDGVMVMYCCGYINLSSYLKQDIQDLCDGSYVPSKGGPHALLVFEHCSKTDYDYETPTDSHLIRIYKNSGGKVVRDTVRTTSPASAADPSVLNDVLAYVKLNYKSDHYSLIFSGHGTGWLEQGSYSEDDGGFFSSVAPSSYGQERTSGTPDHFMDIPDIASAIPMPIDYLVFDSCLMSNVETAYELRNVASRIAASPSQVLMDGFCYKTIASHLLLNDDLESVCRDFYAQYSAQTGWWASCTVSMINTSGLEKLASVVASLHKKYRIKIAFLDEDDVQQYDPDSNYFFDLEDIYIKAGATDDEIAALQEAVGRCVEFKMISDEFFYIKNNHCCGLSMTLPGQLGSEKKNYYRNLQWNKAVSLIN